MRTRLRQLGAGGVQARTFHSAALRQLRYFWPHVHGTELPTLTESKLALLAARRRAAAGRAPTRRCCATSPPRSSGPRSATSTPTTTPRVAAAARPVGHRPRRPRPWRGSSRRTRRSSAARAGWTWRTCCSSPPGCSPRTSGSPRRSAASTSGSSSTSSRTSPRSSRRCSTCGSAAATSSAWSATRPRRSTPSPAPTPTTCATSRRKFPGTTSVELVRNYRSTPQVVDGRQHAARRHRQPGRRAARPAAGRARRSTYAGAPRRGRPRPRAVADRIASLARRRHAAAARSRCCSGSTPSPRPTRRRWPTRGIPYVVRGAARFFDRPEVRAGGHPAARHGPRRRARPATTWSRPCAATLSRAWAGRPSRPTGARSDPRPLGVLAGAGRPGRRSSPRAGGDLGGFVDDLDRRAAEQHAPVADGVTLATFHAAKGLEWDAVFLCGLQDGTLPITYADTPAAVEEERRLLYVGMTRARRDLSLSWALARNPGGRASRKPSPFLDRAAARAEPRRRSRGRRRTAGGPCRECGQPLATAAEKKLGRCADCPAVLRRGALRAAARVAQGRAPTRSGAGVRGLHRRHPAADRRAQAAHDEQALLKISGVGPVQARQLRRRTCSGCVAEAPGPQQTEQVEKYPLNRLPLTRAAVLSRDAATRTRPWQGRRPKHRRRWHTMNNI